MNRDWIDRLTALGRDIRGAIKRQREAGSTADGLPESNLARPVGFEGGDTIFEIDKRVEPYVLEHAERWVDEVGPIRVVAEGLGHDGMQTFGAGDPAWHVLIDPIDGTRNIMYDKRSAWFLGAVAPAGDGPPSLREAIASVLIELPTSKAGFADEISADVDGPTVCRRVALDGSGEHGISVRPSGADSLRHGWGQVTNFFPGTKVLASELMEWIAEETLGTVRAGEALVFDDQYLTTGGQLVELMCGRDRFCCDLRPLFFEIIRRQGRDVAEGLACHPYDMAGLLAAQRAGVIVTDGFGHPLDAPFSVTHGVHWCGYANGSLRDAIEPIIRGWLREKGLDVPLDPELKG
ncbi:MAG: hypothetical protein H6810_06595 [Phycisphaeraceae bacterium]|nr:MAG: hypothetical protein H6810_06595 [Phycisphaeraceae bacterium]